MSLGCGKIAWAAWAKRRRGPGVPLDAFEDAGGKGHRADAMFACDADIASSQKSIAKVGKLLGQLVARFANNEIGRAHV